MSQRTCPKMTELRKIYDTSGINFGDPILRERSRRKIETGTWAMLSGCECGEVFSAVSSTPDACIRLINRKARKHWGPKIGKHIS